MVSPTSDKSLTAPWGYSFSIFHFSFIMRARWFDRECNALTIAGRADVQCAFEREALKSRTSIAFA
jgi:hypothetical protein